VASILLTKIPKLLFYEGKTLLETIAFFLEWCFQKQWVLEQNLIQLL